MHLSVNLCQLKRHQEHLIQEVAEAERIKLLLTKLYQVSLNDPAVDHSFYLKQLEIIDRVIRRIRQRQVLLEETFEVLSNTKEMMTQKSAEAYRILKRVD